jgi:hypothetical protein
MSSGGAATQGEKAEAFRALHRGPEILVLPNAWDCASARIVEEAGFPALATTGAGVANSLGYSDGERIPAAEMLAAVARIVRSVRVPVTADLEAGYRDVAATAAGLVASGAVGLNLEDGGGDPAQHAARIATVRRVGRELGVNWPSTRAPTCIWIRPATNPPRASIGPASGRGPTSMRARIASSFRASRTRTPSGASSRRCVFRSTFWPWPGCPRSRA